MRIRPWSRLDECTQRSVGGSSTLGQRRTEPNDKATSGTYLRDGKADELRHYFARQGLRRATYVPEWRWLSCQRVDGFAELRALLLPAATTLTAIQSDATICARCKQPSKIELHGGRWCSRCGRFTSPPDLALLPSNQPGYVESSPSAWGAATHTAVCGWCNQGSDMLGGIFDDGEWMCGGCIARYVQ